MIMGVIMALIPYGEKGRPIGENHGFARWSDKMIEKVRSLFEDDGMRPAEISRRYGIPKSTLSNILNYKARAVTPVCWSPPKNIQKPRVLDERAKEKAGEEN